MYNPYTSAPGHSLGSAESRPSSRGSHDHRQGGSQNRRQSPLSGLLGIFGTEQKDAGIAGILKKLNLQDIDSGDVLLLLIILLLVLEGDETEMVVTLALLLLMGLGDRSEEGQV